MNQKSNIINKRGNKLKIGFLSSYLPDIGGVSEFATRMASYLIDNGHQVHFIGYDYHENPPELRDRGIKLHKIESMEIPTVRGGHPFLLSLASKMHDVNKEVGFDLVHAHYAIPHSISTYLAQKSSEAEGMGFPYIVTGHGTDIHTFGTHNNLREMVRLGMESADALTYVSQGLRAKAESPIYDGGIGIRKLGRVIENFVDTNMFYPDVGNLREELGIPKGAFVLGHVSNFAPIKQTNYFNRLAKNLQSSGDLNDIYFIMVGEGKFKDDLESAVNNAGYGDHFRFLGKLDSHGVRKSFSSMDFSSLTSKREGCSLSILESLACGTPVIGTNNEGINSTIDDSYNGFLFDQDNVTLDVFADDISDDDVERFADIVRKVKGDRELISRMGSDSLSYAIDNHSIDSVIRKYMNLYQEVINSRLMVGSEVNLPTKLVMPSYYRKI